MVEGDACSSTWRFMEVVRKLLEFPEPALHFRSGKSRYWITAYSFLPRQGPSGKVTRMDQTSRLEKVRLQFINPRPALLGPFHNCPLALPRDELNDPSVTLWLGVAVPIARAPSDPVVEIDDVVRANDTGLTPWLQCRPVLDRQDTRVVVVRASE